MTIFTVCCAVARRSRKPFLRRRLMLQYNRTLSKTSLLHFNLTVNLIISGQGQVKEHMCSYTYQYMDAELNLPLSF